MFNKIIVVGVVGSLLAALPAVAAVTPAIPQAAPAAIGGVQIAAADPLVKQAQEALQKAKFDPGPADGVMGPKTISALKAFQRSKGFAQSGILDGATATALGVKR